MPLGPLRVPWTPRRAWQVARGFVVWSVLVAVLLLFNLVQIASFLVRPFSHRSFRRINTALAGAWWTACVVVARRLNGTRILVSGDDVPDRENAILTPNHQEMPDITVVMDLAVRKHRIGHLKFFVKDALKWTPGVGWGMYFLGFPFLKRDWTRDRDSIVRTFRSIVDERLPVWMVIFPEGTRIRPHKLEASRRYAAEHGLTPPRHVLLPRPKGFVAAVQALRGHVTAVYDLTIAYEEGIPTLGQYISGAVERVHLHVRRYPMEVLPEDPEDLARWLRARFEEKDDLLETFLTTGRFTPTPDAGQPPTP